MKVVWIIATKELKTFFDSLIAYVLLVLFLGFTGAFTWLFIMDIFLSGQASLRPFFEVSYWTFFFFCPALTMRMLAEENNAGTIELLLTKAVTDWQVVLGKYLGCLIMIGISILFSIPYYITVWKLGPIDHGAVWCGYLGLILMSSAYIGIGIFASSITNNQIVAFLISLFIGVFFMFIFGALGGTTGGILAEIFDYLSIRTHYDSIARGVIDSRDILFFLSITFFSLLLAETALAKRNIVS